MPITQIVKVNDCPQMSETQFVRDSISFLINVKNSVSRRKPIAFNVQGRRWYNESIAFKNQVCNW